MKDFGINTGKMERAIFDIFRSGDAVSAIKELARQEEARHEDRRISPPRPHLHPTKGFAGARKRGRRSNRTS